MTRLFSYGTLQLEEVQLSTFGRRLSGMRDEIVGYEISLIEIRNPEAEARIGGRHLVNAAWNGDPSSLVAGMVFEVTEAELAEADRYEVPFGYVRVEAELKSGGRAWVYVAKLRGPEGT